MFEKGKVYEALVSCQIHYGSPYTCHGVVEKQGRKYVAMLRHEDNRIYLYEPLWFDLNFKPVTEVKRNEL